VPIAAKLGVDGERWPAFVVSGIASEAKLLGRDENADPGLVFASL
jgi:hypothetical protein